MQPPSASGAQRATSVSVCVQYSVTGAGGAWLGAGAEQNCSPSSAASENAVPWVRRAVLMAHPPFAAVRGNPWSLG